MNAKKDAMSLQLSAVGALMAEHRLIERMVRNLRSRLEEFDATAAFDPEYVRVAVDFLRTYADRCHHGKEEDILFAELNGRRLLPEHAEAMAALVADHAWARATTRQLVAATERYVAGEQTAALEARMLMRSLTDFYPGHIEREDHGFFKPAMEYFTQDERAAMADRFREFDRLLIHAKYRGLVEQLEAQHEARHD
jgi:hemerythrin-like domain-containing protein